MQTVTVPVCNIDLFDDKANHFWLGSIAAITERYPVLEQHHENLFYSLLFIEKAEGTVNIDGTNFIADHAQIIIIKPHCINSIKLHKGAVGKLICFTEDFFSLRYNNNVLYHFSFLETSAQKNVFLDGKQMAYWNTLLHLIWNEFELQKKQSEKAIRSYLNIILIELDRLHKPLKARGFHTPAHEKVLHFQKLTEKYFNMHKLPSEYAKMLFISTNYLNKICKKITGQTAGDLIRKQVIIEAQRMLHYTNDAISEIAGKLGFEHVSYFITFFKKHTGKTPEEFRKGSLH